MPKQGIDKDTISNRLMLALCIENIQVLQCSKASINGM